MNHLNYFEPYQSKNAKHEDNLTRAFLVVLRHSISSLMLFYDQAIKSCISMRVEKGKTFSLPFFSELDYKNIVYHTQKTDVSDIVGSSVLSVLITDENFEVKNDIEKSTRGARYDGIISFGDQLSIILENKPKSYNVWEEQLSPNLEGLSKKVDLIPVPAIVTWKELIKNLSRLVSSEQTSGSEKIIISDFLDFVDRNFSFLNPYDNLKQCKKDAYLIDRRIKNIFSEMALNESYFGYQTRWQTYYFETGFNEIRMVGLEKIVKDDGDYSLKLSLYYGDTMNQSRSYFQRNIPFENVIDLKKSGWSYKSNFHISHINSHIIWFNTKSEYEKNYYNYWLSNKNKINQMPKSELIKYLIDLKDSNLIEIDKLKNEKIGEVIINTNRSNFNICPGFALQFSIDSNTAEELDSENKFIQFLKEKIIEGLSILKKEILFLK